MNNNPGNNRRRGRGSNRQQGGQQTNRVDSRARGNAAQLLEKYRKMAHDAHLNGDRVQEESYLQFADHSFRVMADQKQRQEESRQPRRDERPQDQDEAGYGEDNAASGNDARPANDSRDRDDRSNVSQAERSTDETQAGEFEPSDNPFVRESQGVRPRKPRSKPREDDEGVDDAKTIEAEASSGLDPSSLPPAISANTEDNAGDGKEPAEAKPRRRTRRTQPPADDSSDSLEAVS